MVFKSQDGPGQPVPFESRVISDGSKSSSGETALGVFESRVISDGSQILLSVSSIKSSFESCNLRW